MPKENNRPKGENSPNLVTLFSADNWIKSLKNADLPILSNTCGLKARPTSHRLLKNLLTRFLTKWLQIIFFRFFSSCLQTHTEAKIVQTLKNHPAQARRSAAGSRWRAGRRGACRRTSPTGGSSSSSARTCVNHPPPSVTKVT
jgi:hypothetical protein